MCNDHTALCLLVCSFPPVHVSGFVLSVQDSHLPFFRAFSAMFVSFLVSHLSYLISCVITCQKDSLYMLRDTDIESMQHVLHEIPGFDYFLKSRNCNLNHLIHKASLK